MTGPDNTKNIAEGAILTALFLVLAILTYYTPLFILSFVILPTPYVVIMVRTNFKIFLMAAIVGLAALFTIVDPVFALSMGITALLIGGGLGYAFKAGWKASTAMVMATVAILAIFLAFFGLIQLVLDIDLFQEMLVTFEGAFKSQIEILEMMGAPESQIEELQDVKEIIRENVVIFIPASLVAVSIILAYLQNLINGKILEKLGYVITKLPNFRDWRFPPFFTWFYIISAFMLLFQLDLHGYWGMLAANLFLISNYILLIHGLAFAYWFLNEKKGFSNILIIVILIIGLVMPILNMLLVLIGIIDQLLNLRVKLEKQ
ncbi:YybS family protein [Natranaerobius thermophilus]|uniref:Membrane protein-like protein n=1 Tax=Natranaerobius thermophilus (strain ATCC BAA-1301 / DSM 18059 / JW/NM-WN-LF) TaxID=457570 RepID=B2A452_NATTJ|nr:DUF2232 domain-containing protein [Natranaerobius thermophilus]ACB86458.1 membrane protein-like protein [Natranaerobius thermophilus JW/NM-WN-LF]